MLLLLVAASGRSQRSRLSCPLQRPLRQGARRAESRFVVFAWGETIFLEVEATDPPSCKPSGMARDPGVDCSQRVANFTPSRQALGAHREPPLYQGLFLGKEGEGSAKAMR